VLLPRRSEPASAALASLKVLVVDDNAAKRVEDGRDSARGYLFSRPCPADELTTWLRESRFGARVGACR
jgi:hypothetical protein